MGQIQHVRHMMINVNVEHQRRPGGQAGCYRRAGKLHAAGACGIWSAVACRTSRTQLTHVARPSTEPHTHRSPCGYSSHQCLHACTRSTRLSSAHGALIETACPAHACLAPVACRVHHRHGVCLRLHAPQELTIVGCTPLLPPVPAHNSMHGLENSGRFKAKVLPAVQQGCRTTQLDSLPVKAFSGRDTQG